jgi:hypothetical protein
MRGSPVSALEDLVTALDAAVQAFDQAADAVRTADDAADTSVDRAASAGLEGAVAMLKDGQEELAGLLAQLAEAESTLEAFKGRAQALIDDL